MSDGQKHSRLFELGVGDGVLERGIWGHESQQLIDSPFVSN